MDFVKFKNVSSLKDTVKRIKRLATNWEKIFANYSYGKELVSRIYTEPSKLNIKETVKFLNGQKMWTFSQRSYGASI